MSNKVKRIKKLLPNNEMTETLGGSIFVSVAKLSGKSPRWTERHYHSWKESVLLDGPQTIRELCENAIEYCHLPSENKQYLKLFTRKGCTPLVTIVIDREVWPIGSRYFGSLINGDMEEIW